MSEPLAASNTGDLNDISAYDYQLPAERIAQSPVEPRDSSRLLVLNRADGAIIHTTFRHIGEFLNAGDLLVANESRVIPARLHGRKANTGATVEILLLASRPELGATTWEALVRPGRRLQAGTIVNLDDNVTAEILTTTDAGGRIIRFRVDGQEDPTVLNNRLFALGEMPLPPYIHQPLQNPERYQTVYSHTQGSAAAPTAGLHFTPQLITDLQQQGIGFATVTLHVGLDTFRPVAVRDLREHHMHSEAIELSQATAEMINATKQAGKRIVTVGTTTVRTLEGIAAKHGLPLPPFRGTTDIFITPGFQFHVTDAIITNFHLPRSTLLAMISGFAGRDLVLSTYAIAIAEQYRFFSFGDAMLIL